MNDRSTEIQHFSIPDISKNKNLPVFSLHFNVFNTDIKWSSDLKARNLTFLKCTREFKVHMTPLEIHSHPKEKILLSSSVKKEIDFKLYFFSSHL
ncbi:hypothetical protein AC249_AIPGENE2997 [Exaiptasia diaphana]|nr:hypothetical protein AC249_AIPGENE2997 [Exaiptasia diaphana]